MLFLRLHTLVAESPFQSIHVVVDLQSYAEQRLQLGRHGRRLVEKQHHWRVGPRLEPVYARLVDA